MRIWPVILDAVAEDVGRSGTSLLLTPVGTDLLISRLQQRLQCATPNAPVIVPPPQADPAYEAAIRDACPGVAILGEGEILADRLPTLETSDVLLFLDSRWFPADDAIVGALLSQFSASRQVAHHLVALESSAAGTREHVYVDRDGRVRSVHRYYDPATWPFVAGVAASLVPVSSSVLYMDDVPRSLADLRQRLAACGAPGRDVALEGEALDLTRPHGLLAATVRGVVDASDRAKAAGQASTVLVGHGHAIADSARLLGPIVIHAGVRIGERATIVGPALIGPGAQISAGAIVAHAFVGAQSQVPAARTLRDCVWWGDHEPPPSAAETSYQDRLAKLSVELGATSPFTAPQRPAGPARPWYPRWKRLFDVVAAGAGLILLSPFLLLVAILIRLESRGPILYRMQREGLRGRLFNCLKFRTMQVGAHDLQHLLKNEDKLDGPHFKLDQDPRLTRLGRLLRETNVDELPQLVNVFRGEMSLVGPRPSPFRENQICVPWREGRLSVRPGVTGLWQVCRKNRSSGDFHQWIEYDLLYVQHAGPLLDLKILVATVLTMAGRVPVPVRWLVRQPQLPRPVDRTDAGPGDAGPVPARTAAQSAAPD